MVSSEQIIDMIQESMSIQFEDKNKIANSTLQELGLDSLDSLEFLYLIQDKFDFNIKNDNHSNFLNLSPQSICQIINKIQAES